MCAKVDCYIGSVDQQSLTSRRCATKGILPSRANRVALYSGGVHMMAGLTLRERMAGRCQKESTITFIGRNRQSRCSANCSRTVSPPTKHRTIRRPTRGDVSKGLSWSMPRMLMFATSFGWLVGLWPDGGALANR